MTSRSSKKTFGLLFLWVIVATAVGIYLTNLLTKPKSVEFLAPLAESRQCGPSNLDASAEQKLLADWSIQTDKMPTDAQKSLAASVAALPARAAEALKKFKLKVTMDRGQPPYICQTFETSRGKQSEPTRPSRSAENCLRVTGKDAVTLVLGWPKLEMPDGKPRLFSEKQVIDEVALPALFWALLEGLYPPTDHRSKTLPADQPSIQGISNQIRRYVVDGYKFSDEEQNYYFDRFGAAGTETPAFITRTLTLTASQVYCSADSFQRLQKNQPEATKRFMNIYGCALGKPWYMPDSEFSSACPNIASNK